MDFPITIQEKQNNKIFEVILQLLQFNPEHHVNATPENDQKRMYDQVFAQNGLKKHIKATTQSKTKNGFIWIPQHCTSISYNFDSQWLAVLYL